MESTADRTLAALRAVGEATRLRIVAVLQHGELSVTELTEILQQSQPRISRHLRLLLEANVIERHREGNRVFFSLSRDRTASSIVRSALVSLSADDAVLGADIDRMSSVRDSRSEAAQAYFAHIAQQWDQVRSRHAPEADVESAILAVTADVDYTSLLDLGTGTGRMLQLLSSQRPLERIAGLDSSTSMLAVARSNLDAAGLSHVELRHADLQCAPFEPGAFDLVVMHQVLHFLDDPDRAIRRAAELVAPGGRFLIVDLAPHTLDFLQTEHAHRRLGFRPESVAGWLSDAGMEDIATIEIAPQSDLDDGLTVLVWVAVNGADPVGPTPTTTLPEKAPR